eukprot:EG_transcript_29115
MRTRIRAGQPTTGPPAHNAAPLGPTATSASLSCRCFPVRRHAWAPPGFPAAPTSTPTCGSSTAMRCATSRRARHPTSPTARISRTSPRGLASNEDSPLVFTIMLKD